MNKLFLFSLTTLGMLNCLRCDAMIPLFRNRRQRPQRAHPSDR